MMYRGEIVKNREGKVIIKVADNNINRGILISIHTSMYAEYEFIE